MMMMAVQAADVTGRVWNPLSLLKYTDSSKKCLALILLNRPLDKLCPVLKHLWRIACYKGVADGGANHLYDLKYCGHDDYIPDVVSGDFDSCRPEVKEFYKNKGSEVIHTPDQDATDFTKALKIAAERVNTLQHCEHVFVLGAFGGRLDHQMANISTLYEAQGFLNKPVYLLSDDSLAFLLSTGKHTIIRSFGLEDSWCGLVPIGEPITVTTTGLKWNLSNDQLRFGELISTSNTYDPDCEEVSVHTDKPIIWMMGYTFHSTDKHHHHD